jgi:hypothetical protein
VTAETGDRQEQQKLTLWIGWVVFAGLVLFAGGLLNVIQGCVALVDEDYYATAGSQPALDVSYQTWGWMLIVFGALAAFAGYGVLSGQAWARVVAVLVTGLDALLSFAFVAAYPFGSILAIVLDVIVIYALVAHGREARAMRP